MGARQLDEFKMLLYFEIFKYITKSFYKNFTIEEVDWYGIRHRIIYSNNNKQMILTMSHGKKDITLDVGFIDGIGVSYNFNYINTDLLDKILNKEKYE